MIYRAAGAVVCAGTLINMIYGLNVETGGRTGLEEDVAWFLKRILPFFAFGIVSAIIAWKGVSGGGGSQRNRKKGIRDIAVGLATFLLLTIAFLISLPTMGPTRVGLVLLVFAFGGLILAAKGLFALITGRRIKGPPK